MDQTYPLPASTLGELERFCERARMAGFADDSAVYARTKFTGPSKARLGARLGRLAITDEGSDG